VTRGFIAVSAFGCAIIACRPARLDTSGGSIAHEPSHPLTRREAPVGGEGAGPSGRGPSDADTAADATPVRSSRDKIAAAREERPADPASTGPSISADQAVDRAQQFVRDNGYTDAPSLPPEDLTPESIEWDTRERWSISRRGSLVGSAYGYLVGRRGGASGWTVIFCYSRPEEEDMKKRPVGRAVTMNVDGSQPRVEHVPIFLDAAEHRLRECP
jgi:hypothetical protein